jgi:hypothetical protein
MCLAAENARSLQAAAKARAGKWLPGPEALVLVAPARPSGTAAACPHPSRDLCSAPEPRSNTTHWGAETTPSRCIRCNGPGFAAPCRGRSAGCAPGCRCRGTCCTHNACPNASRSRCSWSTGPCARVTASCGMEGMAPGGEKRGLRGQLARWPGQQEHGAGTQHDRHRRPVKTQPGPRGPYLVVPV